MITALILLTNCEKKRRERQFDDQFSKHDALLSDTFARSRSALCDLRINEKNEF